MTQCVHCEEGKPFVGKGAHHAADCEHYRSPFKGDRAPIWADFLRRGIGSYSQFEEDTAYVPLFDRPGRFLDIGAWDPRIFSNTRALYELGWNGVIVEPSPDPFLKQLREYGNDERITLLQAAVGDERAIAQMWCTDDAVSTTEAEQYEKWKDAAKYHGKFFVPVITIQDIFDQFGGPFDFVNLDVEGRSVDLLKKLLATPAFPRCIVVEHDGRETEVISLACSKGYSVIFGNTTNLVLARIG